MAENNITLYIGTAERKERLHDVARKRGYPSTSAMIQALADEVGEFASDEGENDVVNI